MGIQYRKKVTEAQPGLRVFRAWGTGIYTLTFEHTMHGIRIPKEHEAFS